MSQQPNQPIQTGQQIPYISVPALEFILDVADFYVKMNLSSYVLMPGNEISLYRGFLFKVEAPEIQLISGREDSRMTEISFDKLLEIKLGQNPDIFLASNFPCLYHPHFTLPTFYRLSPVILSNFHKIRWVDYDETSSSKTSGLSLGFYLLKVAKSLVYEEGYINTNISKSANREALQEYLQDKCNHPECYPTDKINLPSHKFKPHQIIGDDTKYDSQDVDHLSNRSPQSAQLDRKVKFTIQEQKPAYTPILREKTDLKIDRSLDSNFRNKFDSSIQQEFYLTQAAFTTISNHISWGSYSTWNQVEQGGILLGTVYKNPATGIIYGMAEQAVSGSLARGSAAYLEVTHETWREMLDQVDRIYPNLQIIGWYHTHPNSLDVFMSGTDQTTQRRLFSQDWQFAIVLNPHRRIWRAFYGKNSTECKGYVLSE